jgi:ankyrin repeat protein
MLHHAVLHGNKECVKLLVDAGADINQSTSKYEKGISDEGGWTPLDLAVYFKHEDMREYLEANKGKRGRDDGARFCGTDAPMAPERAP